MNSQKNQDLNPLRLWFNKELVWHVWLLAQVWTLKKMFSFCWIIIEFPMTKIIQIFNISYTFLSKNYKITFMKSHSSRIFQQHYKHVLKSFGFDFVENSHKLIQQFLHHRSKPSKTTLLIESFPMVPRAWWEIWEIFNVHAWQANKPTNNLP
jgi:hypothetical protein